MWSARKTDSIIFTISLVNLNSQSSTNLPKVKISGKLNISTDLFNMRELRVVTDILRNKRSLGLDNIPAILWKDECSTHTYWISVTMCSRSQPWNAHQAGRTVSGIVPVPKKGDLSDPFYYRGISLTTIASKFYNKLILNRLVPSLYPILRRNQNVIKKGPIHHLSNFTPETYHHQEMRNANREMILRLVDFKKAFYSVDRQTMFEIPDLCGISREIVNAIKDSYLSPSLTTFCEFLLIPYMRRAY